MSSLYISTVLTESIYAKTHILRSSLDSSDIVAAYTISSLETDGCHERLASNALRAVRETTPEADPLPSTSDDKALADDVEFDPDNDMKDIGGITFLLAIRDNDLKGNSADDLSNLALVHGNPKLQEEHCLRNEKQDEPDGSKEAVASCRAFIQKKILEALTGLDSTGAPDVNKRTVLPIHLGLRGDVDAPLPTFYVAMGQAIHAIEDSFTHTYRTADGMKITTVMNWVDAANGDWIESRDGPEHEKAMDYCSDPDEFRKHRRELAQKASIEMLKAAIDSSNNHEQRIAATNQVLDTYLTFSPGCTYDNAWCDAKENEYRDDPDIFGCSSNRSTTVLIVMIALSYLVLIRKRFRNLKFLSVIFILLISSTFSNATHAQDKPKVSTPDGTGQVDAPITTPVAEAGPQDPSKEAWGFYSGFSGSINNAAIAGALGVRYRFSKHWEFGWDAELNPWISPNGETTIRLGSFNTYGTAILRFPLAYQNFNLRTTVNAGASTLLINLYGAPRWSTGIFGAFYPLGIEWKASKSFYLILNPLGYALAVPQLQAVPLTYSQYRATIGLEWM